MSGTLTSGTLTSGALTDPRAGAPARARRMHTPAPLAATGLRWELSGPAGAPLVVVLGGISATAHVVATAADRSPGWWEAVAGAEQALDTTRIRVLGVEVADGGRGAAGRPARVVTTADQADLLAALLDELGESRAHAVVGASYGGMVALAFAERHAARLARLVVFSAPHRSHPMTTAVRAVQRRVVELGIDTGQPQRAMQLARALAMTTYRTAREFAERFDAAPVANGDVVAFPVELYLEHCGARFAASCRPERFLALSLSADLHHVRPERIVAPTLLVAAEGDTLVPEEQLVDLSSCLTGRVRLARIETITGHDAFLTEPAQVTRLLSAALYAAEP